MNELYAHQKQGIEFLQKSGCLFWDCGTGKTRTIIETFKTWRAKDSSIKLLVICPINLIENAWGNDIKKFSDFTYCNHRTENLDKDADIYITNYESLISAKKFIQIRNLISSGLWACALDECFYGDTLIETQRGVLKIKDIVVGDKIKNCNGWDTVLGTSFKKLDSWLKIKYNNKWIKCSLNHPFLTETGWKLACHIKKGDKLVRTNEAMRIVQEGISSIQRKEILRNILFSEMAYEYSVNKNQGTQSNDIQKNERRTQEVLCKWQSNSFATDRENKEIKSYIRSECTLENISNTKKYEMEANKTRRKWKAFAHATEQTIETSWKNVVSRICSITRKTPNWISNSLQDRHCQSSQHDRNRSRWLFSLFSKRIRQEENTETEFFRVEDIKIYKPRDNGIGTRNIKKDLFYDLQIDKHPSFDVNGVLVHNSSRLKNPKGVTTKRCMAIKPYFVRRVPMTATPCPNNAMELWSQVTFARSGILPPKFGQFKEQYFCLTRGTQTIETKGLDRMAMARLFKQGWVFDFRPGMKEVLMRTIAPVAMWVKKSEVLDLPEQIDINRMVDMTSEMEAVYYEMLKELITEIAQENVVAQTALVKSLRLRQITSGFSTSDSGNIVCLEQNPKMEVLNEVLEEIGQEQAIIWTNYTQEREAIHQNIGKNAVRLDGTTRDKDKVIQDFTNGRSQYLIADKRSVSHGLTFTACAQQIFYSLDYSAELYVQGRDRTHRIGQKRNCTYYHLMVKNSVDEIMLGVITGKINNQEAVRRLMEWKKT